jgi:excisionase family DNA binding protein
MLAYSIRTAAQVTSVGETTIRTWIKDGILPVTKIGGKRLIQRSDLEQVLDRHKRS